jgi:hypothetical protein
MATSPELKVVAQDERDSLKTVRAGADFAMAAAAALAFLVAPPAGAIALVPAIIRWRTAKEITVQERLIEDPPRADYERPAEPEFEALFLSDAPRHLAGYVEASALVCGFEEAMIQSVEKSLGAQERGDREFSKERAEDAGVFARQTSEAIAETAARQRELLKFVNTQDLADAERELWGAGQFGVDPDLDVQTVFLQAIPPRERPATPLAGLTPEVAAQLFRMGATPDAFSAWSPDIQRSRHPFLSLWRPLEYNTVTKVRLAQAITQAL